MTKGLKKGLTIGGIVVGAIILLMILIPVLFKGKIKEAVLEAANKELNAKVDISDFGLNLFSNFPNATLSLDNASVVGVGDFEKDTLLQAQSASVTIDLFSLFGSDYKISRINLDKASIYAKVLADGRANWDIMKADSTVSATSGEANTPFNLNLKKISVNDCNVIFQNDSTNIKFSIMGWNGDISGDFSASETTLKTKSTINELSFTMDGIPYLVRVKGIAEATINANLDKMSFKFEESNLQVNDLQASVDGTFGFVGEDGMEFDLKLNAPDIQFKDVLSLVPAMYTDDFKDIKTSGTAKVEAYIKGLMEGDTYPAFDVKIAIADAMFQYPSLPKAVNNINVDLTINNPKQGSLDNMIVDVSKFSFNLGGNPFSGSLNVSTPMSDPNLKAQARGTLNLAMIKEVYPLEKGTELNGVLNADISIAAAMSAIEKEQYEKVSAAGHLKLNNMVYKSQDMPDVLIKDAAMEFTPRYVNLSSLNLNIGKNDLSATGRLENFIPYALKDKTLKGQLSLKSNYLNANDFISEETTTGTENTTETSSGEDIIIPKNLDFALTAALNKVVYNKINITNMNGAMTVKDGILSLNNVSANALGGSCKVNGTYNTSDPKNVKVNFGLNLSNVSFAETFKSVESIQKFAPIFENLLGNYSMNLNFNTTLGQSILQTLGALAANGSIQTSNVKVENMPVLTALSSALKIDGLKSFSAKDINLPFSISDGKIATKPFSLNLGDGGVMKLEGTTGLDESINYKGTVTLPKSMSNKYVSAVPITIGGTFTKPKIGVDSKALVGDAINSVLGNALGGSSNAAAGSASAKVAEEKAKQIQNLRDQADKAATKLSEEAEKASADLVSKAGSNPIAKAAAKAAGKKLVDEAKKQGDKLKADAESQITKLEQ